jgi:hypothetical protein
MEEWEVPQVQERKYEQHPWMILRMEIYFKM